MLKQQQFNVEALCFWGRNVQYQVWRGDFKNLQEFKVWQVSV